MSSPMTLIQRYKQTFTAVGPGNAEAVAMPRLALSVIVEGSGAVAAVVKLQTTDTPTVESSWVDAGIAVTVSGATKASAGDIGIVTQRHFRAVVVSMTGARVEAKVGDFDDVESLFPVGVQMLVNSANGAKSDVVQLPSRSTISLDVVITGTATLDLYASNIETDKDGSRWGAPVRSFTASEKVLIDGEPWVNWMIHHASGAGSSNVAVGV